jgi:hypothetical protein
LTRPMNSSMTLGLFPAAWITLGVLMNVGIEVLLLFIAHLFLCAKIGRIY